MARVNAVVRCVSEMLDLKSVHSRVGRGYRCDHSSTPLDRIRRNQVLRWFDAYSLTAPGGANHSRKLPRQLLNLTITCGHIGTNPARRVKRNRGPVLTRFLSRDEIGWLYDALDARLLTRQEARQQADIIRLLLLTGCRKRQILSLRWSEVAGDALALRGSKTGPRSVPLNAQARRIIERQPRGRSAFVFPSPVHPTDARRVSSVLPSPCSQRSNFSAVWNSPCFRNAHSQTIATRHPDSSR